MDLSPGTTIVPAIFLAVRTVYFFTTGPAGFNFSHCFEQHYQEGRGKCMQNEFSGSPLATRKKASIKCSLQNPGKTLLGAVNE
jgi:hypothetical protein